MGDPLADHVLEYLAEQRTALRDGERRLLHGDLDAVHPTRVAARRFRSTLKTFAPMFPRGKAARVAKGLRRYAGSLSELRDQQVLIDVVEEHRAACPGAVDEATRRLESELQRHRSELSTVVGKRPRRLRKRMRKLMAQPRVHAIDVPAAVASMVDEVGTLLATAGEDPERLHAARKAAKRARYAAEAVDAGHDPTPFREIQDLLGRHHDRIVAAEYVHDVADSDELRRRLLGEAEEARVAALQVAREAGLLTLAPTP